MASLRQACSSQILSICQTQPKLLQILRQQCCLTLVYVGAAGEDDLAHILLLYPLSNSSSLVSTHLQQQCTWESALAQVRLASRMICNNIGQRTLILDSKFSILGTGGNPRFNNCLWYSEVRPSSTIQLLSQYVTFHHFDLPNPTKRANCADPKYI